MTRPLLPTIRHAEADDIDLVADLIGEAFSTLAPTAWLIPEPKQRRPVLAAQVRILAEHALVHGEIHLLDDASAVAVWLHRDGPLPAPPDYDARLAAACGIYTERFRILDALFDTHHPGLPHHHLAFLAVRPKVQGTGRGSRLLRHQHAHLDTAGIPAYLEAATETNRKLYASHGYHPWTPFALPDGTRFHPMWRPPHHDAPSIPSPPPTTTGRWRRRSPAPG